MVPVTDIRGRGEVGSEQILSEVLAGTCEWHCLGGGRTSGLYQKGSWLCLGTCGSSTRRQLRLIV